MNTYVRVAVSAAVVVLIGVGAFFVGMSFSNGGDARFAVAIARMPGVDLVSLSGSEVFGVSFDSDSDSDVEIEEILAVRDRFKDTRIPQLDVAGVHGDVEELELVAPVMIAVARVVPEPTSVSVREVSDKVWIEVSMAEGAVPADGAALVLPLLQEFAEHGVPDNVEVVGANTWGEQLDLVTVGPDALQNLNDTIGSLTAVGASGQTGTITCGEAGCEAVGP